MGVQRVEFQDDYLRVHYHLEKPSGIPDQDGVIEIRYDQIRNLPLRPAKVGSIDRPCHMEQWTETIEVPPVGATIELVFDREQEQSWGIIGEESLYGPYRVVESRTSKSSP